MARPKRPDPWHARRGDQNNGIFYAYWYNDEKRSVDKISMGTSSAVEAAEAFALFMRDGARIRKPRPSGEMTVERALDDYITEHVNIHCADGERQKHAIAHLRAFFGDKLLSDIDVPLSKEYAAARMAGTIGGGERRKNRVGASSTVRRELNVLVAAANHAVWMKRTKETVQVDLPPERRLGPDDEAPYYTMAELARIFEKAKEYDTEKGTDTEPFLRLLYQTGARRRSIQDLTRDQVKSDARRIILQKPGKKATRKRQPIVPILLAMEPALNVLLAKDGFNKLFEQADYYVHYRKITAMAGIDDARRHPHIMRHTRATHLLQDGKSIYDVAKLLGDTVKTVERVYGHHSAEHLASRLED